MNIFKIKTSEWEDEDFVLFTQLSEKQVRSVIKPMIDDARENEFIYSGEDYVAFLRDTYPKSVILVSTDDPDIIEF